MRLHALMAAAAALVVAGTLPAVADRFDETPRIAVISAFPPEWPALMARLERDATHTDNGVEFVTGTIAGEDVVLFLSGVSMVNAAMTTQLALERFNIEAIAFSGIAGGVDPELSLGDLVVADRWGPYLHMVIAREENGAYTVPSFYEKPFANFGMMFTQPVEVRREGSDGFEEIFWFPTDPGLLAVAQRAAASVELKACDEAGTCLTEPPEVVMGGNGVSGSAFVDNAEFREHVSATFDAKVLDMESAAVAQVAHANGVPFIAFRALSDLAGGGDHADEMSTFLAIAAENSAAMVEAFLEARAAGPQ
ncbi:MAG: 5'-methylthioadenosine/S-adenosylhomocysteine nucleosidase [Pseudomonadota bacterium]